MNSSSSNTTDQSPEIAFSSFAYPDIGIQVPPAVESEQEEADAPQESAPPAGPSPEEIEAMIRRARAETAAETESRLRVEFDSRSAAEKEKVRQALERFQTERKDYFSRVESEVIQLCLAIAAKILHREAQVDPMLLAALVRFAIDKLHDGSSVSVRVSPATAAKWRAQVANPLNGAAVKIVEDMQLSPDDCILETEMGSANFSLDTQLKEIEQGFFDLLTQRPQ